MNPRGLSRRILLVASVCAFWAVAYFATSYWNTSRAWNVFAWDWVWYFPVIPAFVIVYLSAYLMPAVAFVVVRDEVRLRRLAAVAAGVVAVSAACFVIWPTTILRPDLPSGVWGGVLAWLYRADRPTDLFPSLHVAMSFLMAKAVGRERPTWRPAMLAWALLIAVSTLLIRQHYVIDVIGGLVIAYLGWFAYVRPAPRREA